MKILLRRPELEERLGGRSRSAIYVDISRGMLPPPIVLGARCSAWPAREIDAIIEARIAGKSDEEIRKLVSQLVAARKTAA